MKWQSVLAFAATIAFASFEAAHAAAPELPASAKKVTWGEMAALNGGKPIPVSVEIYDLPKPITADLVWDFKKKTITGNALVDGKDKIKVRSKLSAKGDQFCAQNGKEITCNAIYMDGQKFYEVTAAGGVHAVSTMK